MERSLLEVTREEATMTRVKWMVVLSLMGCGPVVDGTHQGQQVAVNSSSTSGGTTTGGGGGGGDGTTCKSVTLHGRVFYNDQRKYGRFPLRHDQSGALGVQYAVRNGDNRADHTANYLGMLDATVQIYEVDQSTSGPDCSATTFEGSTTVAADGTWTWSGEVCDPCYGDDLLHETSEANRTGVSLAVKIQTRYCPNASSGRCFSVKSVGFSLQSAPAFDDHADGAWTYELWTGAASQSNPRRVYQDPADITLADAFFQTALDTPTDRYSQAANVFASLVDVTRKMHVTYSVPFNNGFGEVKAIYPMNWVSGGGGHSHQANFFCLPAQIAGDQTGTVGDIVPNVWPTDSTALHEYGHVLMYRAWDGFGKWTRLDFDIDGDGNIDADEEGNWDTLEFYGNATKEPWANFVRRVALNGVTDGSDGTNKETLDELGCDRSTGFDDDVSFAAAACALPTACADGRRSPEAVQRALCDWWDDRVDGADPDGDAWNGGNDAMAGEDFMSIYEAMRDAWDLVGQNIRDNYITATTWSNGVTRGVHICDFAEAHLNAAAGDRSALDQTLKQNGIDCDL